MNNGLTGIGRINAVDALRGFAISAILLYIRLIIFFTLVRPNVHPNGFCNWMKYLSLSCISYLRVKLILSLPYCLGLHMHFNWRKGYLKAWI